MGRGEMRKALACSSARSASSGSSPCEACRTSDDSDPRKELTMKCYARVARGSILPFLFAGVIHAQSVTISRIESGSLVSICSGETDSSLTRRSYRADWVRLELPDTIARADSLHRIEIDDQWCDDPPSGYSIHGDSDTGHEMLMLGLLDPRHLGRAPDSGNSGAGAVAIECPSGSGPDRLVIAMSPLVPGVYHIFALWNATRTFPVVGLIGRSRDIWGARVMVTALRAAKLERPGS